VRDDVGRAVLLVTGQIADFQRDAEAGDGGVLADQHRHLHVRVQLLASARLVGPPGRSCRLASR
jgi:hypothetical protein